MFTLGTPEIITILVVALLVFGPKRLPEIGKSVGQFFCELRRISNQIVYSVKSDYDESELGREAAIDDKSGYRNS